MMRPHRFENMTPPGDLLRRAVGIRRLSLSGERDDNYLDQIRELPCLSCGLDPCGEAAHVRLASGTYGKRSAMGKKPYDKFAVCLCPQCHREGKDAQHRVGELVFWHRLGISPLLIASRLYAAKGDLVRMRAIVFQAIAEAAR